MASPGQELASLDFHNLIGGPLIAVVNAQAQAAVTTVNFIKAVGFQPLPQKKKFNKQETLDPIYVTFKYPKETMPFQPATKGVAVTFGTKGVGYTSQPGVQITGGGGTGATATAVWNSTSKEVTDVKITSAGSGYTSNPTITIDAPPTVTGNVQATATVGLVDIAAVEAKFQMMALQVPYLSMLPIPYIRIEDVKLDFNAKIDSTETFEIDQSLEYEQSFDQSASLNFKNILSYSATFKSSFSLQESLSKGTEVNRTYTMGIQVHAVQAEMPAGLEKILNILQTAMVSYPDGKAPVLKP